MSRGFFVQSNGITYHNGREVSDPVYVGGRSLTKKEHRRFKKAMNKYFEALDININN